MINFSGKLCMAPMVRSGELPGRLMALSCGADLVWSPEIVDKKVIQSERTVNEKMNTIDFFIKQNKEIGKSCKNKIIFRTYPKMESGRLIFQIGSCNPELAVEAALKVIKDVDGIDLNCGCPRAFSTHCGMGAELLKNVDLTYLILKSLVEKVGKPFKKSISCKIRILNSLEQTIDFIRKICKSGISCLTIHCRSREMRNRELPLYNYLNTLIPEIEQLGVSLIINGGIESRLDFENLQCSLNNFKIGGMIADSAESNYSVFLSINTAHKNFNLPFSVLKSLTTYFKFAKIFNDHNISNTKFCLLNQLPTKSNWHKLIASKKSFEELNSLINSFETLNIKFSNKILLKSLQKQKLIDESNYFTYFSEKKRLYDEIFKNSKSTESVFSKMIFDKECSKVIEYSHDENLKKQKLF